MGRRYDQNLDGRVRFNVGSIKVMKMMMTLVNLSRNMEGLESPFWGGLSRVYEVKSMFWDPLGGPNGGVPPSGGGRFEREVLLVKIVNGRAGGTVDGFGPPLGGWNGVFPLY